MDRKRKIPVKDVPDVQSEQEWFADFSHPMPQNMRQAIQQAVREEILKQPVRSRRINLIIRTLAAACLLIFASYTYEQVYALKKLNRLETRLAADTPVTLHWHDQIDRVLVLNALVDWDQLSRLDPENILSDYSHFFPAWFQANVMGGRQWKMKLDHSVRSSLIQFKAD